MITALDNLLRHLFMTQVDTITEEGQIGFQPPDEAWRTAANSVEKALNIYLFDLRENRKLRSSERVRSVTNGVASEEPAPARLDCHYLISAWSRVQEGEDDRLKPTLDEHTLLYAVTAVLMKNAPLNPARVYGGNTADEKAWGPFWKTDLPAQVLPAEGFPKLAEFWGAMGVNNRWKPAVYLVVTLPVAMEAITAGPIVTTRVIEYRVGDQPMTADNEIHLGGRVRTAARQVIPGALIELVEAGLRTTTDSQGRFEIPRLAVGAHTLRVTAVGYELHEGMLQIPGQINDCEIVMRAI